MEKSEPTFVPEWLKSSGSLNTTSHHSDEQGVLKAKRNKLLVNVSDNDIGRPSVSEKTTSSYFRRASSSNGSPYLRSYGSFGRYSDKEKAESRHHDYSDPLGSILPSRFEKEGLRRSHSSLSTKRGDSWPRKVVNDSTIVNKSSHGHSNGGALRSSGGISGVKTAFERDFPSLGAEEKQDSEIGRVPSPGLSSAIQSLPIGSSAVIGGDGWTSALAEVPVIVGSNGSNTSVVQPVQSTSISATTSMTTGRNMAETLAQGPPRAQTAPQLSVGTQRLGHNNGGGLRSSGGISGVKTAFERDFLSLGAKEKQDSEISRVSSPGLSSAIQSLPIGRSVVIGGVVWKSALAEVPVIVGSNGSNTSVVQPVHSTSISTTTSMTIAICWNSKA